MADLFVYGDMRVDAALRLRAGVLHVFCKAEQDADGELIVQKTALYVSGCGYPCARVEAHKVADLDAERAGVLGGLDVLVQHKLGRVEAALGVGEVAVDMDGGVAELERTFNDRAAAGVQPRVLGLAVRGAQPAEIRQAEAAAALYLGHHSAERVGVRFKQQRVGSVLAAEVDEHTALFGDLRGIAEGFKLSLHPVRGLHGEASGAVDAKQFYGF